jgi:alpha-L-rhamnosidase
MFSHCFSIAIPLLLQKYFFIIICSTMSKNTFSRRHFFKTGTIGGASLLMMSGMPQKAEKNIDYSTAKIRMQELKLPSKYGLDLAPAKWIWYPSQRTLPNTFILFRKSVSISKAIESAKGWIVGDSRYLLSVNGKRVQWGPPPADPRFTEADPIDLKALLLSGDNVIGANVLYYGFGDGTWPVGKPGFIFNLKITFSDGTEQLVISDGTWNCQIARSWKPGQYKRWYLRSLQEEFDARKFPYGWDSKNNELDKAWIPVDILRGQPNETALSTNSSDYMYNSSSESTVTELRKRSIPMVLESEERQLELVEVLELSWKRPIADYFEMIVPNAYEVAGEVALSGIGPWEVQLSRDRAVILTFKVFEQMVGWPFFSIDAPEGTNIEVLVQEGHELFKNGGPPIMNNHFHSWTRFVCKEGLNHFETYDFESIKWMQLHIHGADGKIRLEKPGIRRRKYDWPNPAKVRVSDENLQKIIDACINTTYNNSLDTIVDGMGRERQQYSGDIGHMLHIHYRVFGEQQLPARYLNTYSQGLTKDGFFLDTWPAYDRLNRLAQRQLDLTRWGPLLDHGVGFNFDCYHHYLYTGDLTELEEVWPRLVRFFNYLKSIVDEDGLLPVEDIGIPAVWIDHDGYKMQRHKQCAFNLYASAMFKNAFKPLASAQGQTQLAREAQSFSDSLLKQVIAKYWDANRHVYICNKPWINEEKEVRMCDRSLSTAVLFDLVPDKSTDRIVEVLESKPVSMGMSYPPNTNWYLWALGKAGKTNAIFNDFDQRWIKLRSIHQNNTMQEAWDAAPDSSSQWSHAAIAPLITVYSDLAGIRPLQPGYKHFNIQPSPGSLELLELSNYTPHGPIDFSLKGKPGKRTLKLRIPKGISGELVLDEREKVKLKEVFHANGKRGFDLNGLVSIELKLKFT